MNWYYHIFVYGHNICNNTTTPYIIVLKKSGKVMIHPLFSKGSVKEEVYMAVILLPCGCQGDQYVPFFHLYLKPNPLSVRPAAIQSSAYGWSYSPLQLSCMRKEYFSFKC